MKRSFKINTALVICLAFIFRILFVNIGLLSSISIHHHGVIKGHFSSNIKKRKHPDVVNQNSNIGLSATEICEENTNEDEDEQLRFNPFVLLHNFFSFLSFKTTNQFEKLSPQFNLLSSFSSDRYLKLQVIRI